MSAARLKKDVMDSALSLAVEAVDHTSDCFDLRPLLFVRGLTDNLNKGCKAVKHLDIANLMLRNASSLVFFVITILYKSFITNDHEY